MQHLSTQATSMCPLTVGVHSLVPTHLPPNTLRHRFPPPLILQEVVAGVRQLVAVEAAALVGEAALGAAARLLKGAPPGDLLAAALRHFQQLFDCPQLEGVIPAMNKVSYVHWLLQGHSEHLV